MAVFGLVHGAWHGAWCWSSLEDELRARGHGTVAMDLPCDDETCGTAQYAAAVVDALADVDEPVVLVGHSLGGLTIPLVADRRPVRHLVYLCAVLRDPGKTLAELYIDGPEVDIWVPGQPGTSGANGTPSGWAEDDAIQVLYHDCPRDVAVDAVRRLRRQRSLFAEPSPQTAWPDLPVTSVVCEDDRIVSSVWGRRATRERFGIEAVVMPGGHSPMLAQPAALADILTAIDAGG